MFEKIVAWVCKLFGRTQTTTGSTPVAANGAITPTPAAGPQHATNHDPESQQPYRTGDDCYQLALLAILTLGGGFLPGLSTAGQLIFFGMFALAVQGLGRTVYARSTRCARNDALKTWTIMTVITYAALAVYALARASENDKA